MRISFSSPGYVLWDELVLLDVVAVVEVVVDAHEVLPLPIVETHGEDGAGGHGGGGGNTDRTANVAC